MDASLLEAASGGGSGDSPRRPLSWSRKAILSGSLMMVMGLCGVFTSRWKRDSADAYNTGEILVKMDGMTSFAVVPYTSQCYAFTGGTCAFSPCNANRSATCLQTRCVCLDGCTGADGKCYGEHYESAIPGPNNTFTLTNVYWPQYQLYMQGASWLTDQLKVSNWWSGSFLNTNLFTLYKLPGVGASGKTEYFLASYKWPSWVVSIASTKMTAVSLFGAFAYNLYHTVAPWDPAGLTVHLCSLKKLGYENAVMIGSSGILGDHWMYIHHGSWLVYATAIAQDPGEGGYWTPNPPIPDLDDC